MTATSPPAGPIIIPARIQANPWLVLLVLIAGFILILLDTTIVNIAIPQMERGLSASFDMILWVVNAYLLVYAVLLVLAGRLGDMFGPKRVYIAGLAIFTGASLLCAVSQNAGELIAFRAIQGVGAALLTPQTLALVPFIFPAEKRGAAQGAWAASSGLGLILGPVVGGFLVTNFDWQSIFYINVPIGIATIVAAVLIAPEAYKGRRPSFDIVGTGLLAACLALILYALIEAQRFDWGPVTSAGAFSVGPTRWSLISIYSLFVYAGVLLALFVWYERRTEEPVLPLGLFRQRNISGGVTLIFIALYALLGIALALTIFWQSVLGFSAIHAGLTMIALALPVLLVSPIGGRLTDEGYGKPLAVVGFAVVASGIALLPLVVALDNTSWSFALPLGVCGVGMGLLFPSSVALTMRDVPPSLVGSASGAFFTMRQMGGSLGTAMVGTILAHLVASGLTRHATAAAASVPPAYRSTFLARWRAASHAPQQFGSGQDRALGIPHGVPPAVAERLAALSHQVFSQAFIDALRPAVLVCAGACLVGALVALLMQNRPTVTPESLPEREVTPKAHELPAR
jgi:EmrB/QacA subfamily drug resistance transporter